MKREKEKEKIPHVCESKGPRPLRGHCPKMVKIQMNGCKVFVFFHALSFSSNFYKIHTT